MKNEFIQLKTISWVLMLFSSTAFATGYYVATNGSDSADGSLSTPFLTIQKAADVMLAGDTCYIRGGTYRETLTPAGSGTAGNLITFMPYNDEEVTISGADPVTGWTAYSNNIYKAVMDWDLGAGFNQLFVDGAMVNEARWPNTGTNLLNPTTASATAADSSVTFSVSRPVNYWVGGSVCGLFGYKWTSQGASITASSSGGALTITDKTSHWYTGSGNAYITGIFGELDAEGEWFLDGTNLYLWAPGSVDPSTVAVETKARKWCVNLSGKSFIRIQDIDLFAGSIRMDTDHCEILGCNAKYLSHFTKYTWNGMDAGGNRAEGDNGVYIDGDGNIVSNCTFTFSAGSGVLIYGASNTVTRSVISQMDYSATYSCPMAIKGSTGGNRILFNTMHDTARDVLQLYGATADVIMYNDLYSAGRMCHDLGITYQWGRDGQGTVIAYNWIHDNHAAGPGIYNDNYCRNFIEHHNVIWNCEAGVRLNRPHDQLEVYNNTLFFCDNVNTHTYNQYPNYMPEWWIYGDANNHALQNNLYLGSSPGSQLEDYANDDFTLKSGAAAIDAGSVVEPYTDGYQGANPDLGAYEAGLTGWRAGHLGVPVQPSGAPNIVTAPASDVAIDTASLNGSLMSTGSAPTEVWAFWGDNDAICDKTSWDHSITFGANTSSPPVAYVTNLTDLTPGTTYYCRFYATNAFGEAWGDVVSFTPALPFGEKTVTCPVSTDLDIGPDGSKSVSAATLIAGNIGSGDRRIFIKFDLSDVPGDLPISSAVLRLYHIEGNKDTYGQALLYGVTNGWTADSLTYAHPVGDNLDQITGNNGPFNEFKEVDVTTVIREYQSDTNSHHGFSVRGEEGYTLTGKYFVSSEGSAGQRPELIVTYAVSDSDDDGIPDAWEWKYFGSLTTATANTDSDEDGLCNLYEYGLDGDPTNALDQGTLPAFTNAGGVFLFIHPQRSDDTNLIYTVETTTNLVDGIWTNEGYTVMGTRVTGGTLDYVTNDVDTAEDERFIRLKIER